MSPLSLYLTVFLTTNPAPSAAVSETSAPGPTHAEELNAYPQRLADRPLAIGAGLFEAQWQGGYQFNSSQGFGEVPNVRYGLSSQWEAILLGMRFIVSEDGQYFPGLALRFQLHDLAYQREIWTNQPYPALRPGLFAELRDRLPYHVTANFSGGYEMSIQANSDYDNGQPVATADRISQSFIPLILDIQYSPLDMFSIVASGALIADTHTDPFVVQNQSDVWAGVAAVWTQSSRFDLRVYGRANWFSDQRLGFVPEVGAGAAIRL